MINININLWPGAVSLAQHRDLNQVATASLYLSKGKETSDPHNLVELCLPNSFKRDHVEHYFLVGGSDFLQMSNYSFKLYLRHRSGETAFLSQHTSCIYLLATAVTALVLLLGIPLTST